MSTPYNNQWVLGRSRARWRRRAPAAAGDALGQPPVALPQGPHERAPSVHDRPRTSLGRPARKRPRWIDRDT
jgi:hypothetical protein